MDKSAAIVVLFVCLTALFFAYVKHSKETAYVNGEEYQLAGMMNYDDHGTTIYVPVFRRLTK